jgi:hypothetical protein
MNKMPTNKVAAGGAAGALATIAVWAVQEFAKTPVPPEVAVALSALFTFVVQWFVPDRR